MFLENVFPFKVITFHVTRRKQVTCHEHRLCAHGNHANHDPPPPPPPHPLGPPPCPLKTIREEEVVQSCFDVAVFVSF